MSKHVCLFSSQPTRSITRSFDDSLCVPPIRYFPISIPGMRKILTVSFHTVDYWSNAFVIHFLSNVSFFSIASYVSVFQCCCLPLYFATLHLSNSLYTAHDVTTSAHWLNNKYIYMSKLIYKIKDLYEHLFTAFLSFLWMHWASLDLYGFTFR